jgi:hypothetical protein
MKPTGKAFFVSEQRYREPGLYKNTAPLRSSPLRPKTGVVACSSAAYRSIAVSGSPSSPFGLSRLPPGCSHPGTCSSAGTT